MQFVRFFCVTLALAGLGVLLLAGCGSDSLDTRPRVAYIYATDIAAAQSFHSFFDSHNWRMEAIAPEDVETTDFSPYILLVIAADTDIAGVSAFTSTQAQALKDSDVPILGIKGGGARLYADPAFDLECQWGHDMLFSNNYLTINDTAFFTGIVNGDTVGATMQVTEEPEQALGVSQANITALTTGVARDTTNTSYYPVAVQGKYGLWGYPTPPSGMTDEGRILLWNVMNHLQAQ
ncbi:MAG: hypothetical protein ACYDBB_24765 [Armatimonadota bacterium]